VKVLRQSHDHCETPLQHLHQKRSNILVLPRLSGRTQMTLRSAAFGALPQRQIAC